MARQTSKRGTARSKARGQAAGRRTAGGQRATGPRAGRATSSRASKGARTAAPRRAAKRGRLAKAPEIRATNLTPEDRRFLARYGARLSPAALRAKWVHSPREHADRPGQTLATRSHEVIRAWARARGAVPATVATTAAKPGEPRVLTFDFPGYKGRRLEKLTWDEWFRVFDRRKLVFLFQESKADGSPSNFFKLDSPEREEA